MEYIWNINYLRNKSGCWYQNVTSHMLGSKIGLLVEQLLSFNMLLLLRGKEGHILCLNQINRKN